MKVTDRKDIISYFQCGVCYETFNDRDRCPRNLMCGHTFCQKCISQIIDYHQQFHCPYCKTNLKQLRFGLCYKNFSLLKLMQLNNIETTQSITYTISKQTFGQIVDQMSRLPKNAKKLIIKRTRDDESNPFEFDLIRSNRQSMRFYKLLVIFQKLQHFQFWVKFSAHGFEECLAESLNELPHLKTVKIVNAYDQYSRINELITLVSNQNIQFDITIRKWEDLE